MYICMYIILIQYSISTGNQRRARPPRWGTFGRCLRRPRTARRRHGNFGTGFSLGIHRKSVKIPGKPWKITGNLWKIYGNHGKSHGKPSNIWETRENHRGVPDFRVQDYGKSCGNYIEHLKTYSRTMESSEYISLGLLSTPSRFKGHQVFGHLALQFGPSLSPFAMRGGVPDSSLKSHKKRIILVCVMPFRH